MVFNQSPRLTLVLEEVVGQFDERARVYISLLDLSRGRLDYAGFQDTQPVYAASIPKIDIAACVLDEESKGNLSLLDQIEVTEMNIVGNADQPFSDTRPLLMAGQKVSVAYLLDLMITGSHNTPANVLIDLVGREKINAFIQQHGWTGNEFYRKFLPKEREDPRYSGTKTVNTMRHFTEFLYLVKTKRLIDHFSSSYLHDLLYRQLDKTKIARGLPRSATFVHKTGWNAYPRSRDGQRVGVSGDCGIVYDGAKRYIVSCVVVWPDEEGCQALSLIGECLHALM